MTLKVLSVVSEAYPLIKTGGLADVAGALPAALAPYDVRLTTLIPGYPPVMKALEKSQTVHHYKDLLGVEAHLVGGIAGGLEVIVLDAPALYTRGGGPYAGPDGKDWPDNWRRFAALGRAGADVAAATDLLHAHDWQAAMAAAYLRFDKKTATPSVVTIHNIAFPGRFPAEIFPSLGLPLEAFSIDGVEYFGGVGFLKSGLQAADAITTVSPTYAEQIHEPEFGMGLDGLIAARRDRVFGIVNGIDTAVWNPASDQNLAAVYDDGTLRAREENRRAAEVAFGLSEGEEPLFCAVSRLTQQKGMDVLAAVVDELVAMGGRLAVLGTGEAEIEAAFTAAAVRYPGAVGVRIGYDEALSHLLQGGADAIVIPSRFEPCGLTQLYGLRYGCIPVAARTGGLADTIVDANEAALASGAATGFLFDSVTPEGLTRALQRAMGAFGRREIWRCLQKRGMKTDFSWARSGQRYAELYKRLVNKSL
ncbi:MAG: glycogen synthase GlgA [Alphaproteobacteria bacterium]|nr:glycogen synthase GlgA [Alphaproteobacteria bacterium]MDE2111648.1 glycogen synthase GlgA [Alphaproteobacteria bacterium]MDE2494256.1 glycogen synthase GlgA [Alphaproteobacteria bacterium]